MLIDLCVTNAPSNITNAGVIELSKSKHVLVYMTHRVHYKQMGSCLVQKRIMKILIEKSIQEAWNNKHENANHMVMLVIN